MSKESKKLFLLFATHSMLYTSYGNKSKKQEKLSAKDAFEKIVVIVSSEGLISQYLEKLHQDAENAKIPVQPHIIAIGTGLVDVAGIFFLCFDSHKYRINDIDSVLEVFLKMHMLFNLKFPLETKNLLEFLTSLLFQYKYDLSAKCKTLMHLFENHET